MQSAQQVSTGIGGQHKEKHIQAASSCSCIKYGEMRIGRRSSRWECMCVCVCVYRHRSDQSELGCSRRTEQSANACEKCQARQSIRRSGFCKHSINNALNMLPRKLHTMHSNFEAWVEPYSLCSACGCCCLYSLLLVCGDCFCGCVAEWIH